MFLRIKAWFFFKWLERHIQKYSLKCIDINQIPEELQNYESLEVNTKLFSLNMLNDDKTPMDYVMCVLSICLGIT